MGMKLLPTDGLGFETDQFGLTTTDQFGFKTDDNGSTTTDKSIKMYPQESVLHPQISVDPHKSVQNPHKSVDTYLYFIYILLKVIFQ